MIRQNQKKYPKSNQRSIGDFFTVKRNVSSITNDINYKNGMPIITGSKNSPIKQGKSPEKMIELTHGVSPEKMKEILKESQPADHNKIKINLMDQITAEDDELEVLTAVSSTKVVESRESMMLAEDFKKLEKSSESNLSSNILSTDQSNSEIQYYRDLKRKRQKLTSSQMSLHKTNTMSPLTKTPNGSSLNDLIKLNRTNSIDLTRTNSKASPMAKVASQSMSFMSQFNRPGKLEGRSSFSKSSRGSTSTKKNSVDDDVTKHLELTDEQNEVIELAVNQGLNLFYTGSAGTGKSVVLKTLIQRMKRKYGEDAVAICASTGLASCNIGGITIHKFSGFGIGEKSPDSLFTFVAKRPQAVKRWKKTRVLIVDEVSMIEGQYLDKFDYVARNVRKNNRPFGGIQVIFTGDFFQLPPVSKNGKQTSYCFESQSWKRAIQKTILLNKVFRQKDNSLIEMLNEIRYGERISAASRNLINSLDRTIEYDDGLEATELYPTRMEVTSANAKRMHSLSGKEMVFNALDSISAEVKDKAAERKKLDSSFLAEPVLKLKEGCQVMLIVNFSDKLVNGSIGNVLYFLPTNLYTSIIGEYRNIEDHVAIKEIRMISECVGLTDVNNIPPHIIEYQAKMLNLDAKGRFDKFIKTAMRFKKRDMMPVVRFKVPNHRDETEIINPHSFTLDGYRNKTERQQIPLILCYALSIHKSQGQTIPRLRIDLKKVFEVGQVYVALSRAVSLDALEVRNFDPSKIKCDEKVKKFYLAMKTLE
ncbi:uncharacterized protein HGUI_02911 [Hanseniaspora guilliermondii]|uniref:ATP-dependent DNA helicase PIF1 n=1 Tax=Hanseniaspora guilliermondii TaxID=56406 RepID=A0A1L0D0Q5_9ASCO|nr:uncharacterized protein HGUI_02911 [Hanseniaspora guilliermondii]